ncbi:MAG: ThiF family adenylyltransferase [Clostridia bacterium]|nr:ThiF family adenylyltransferase [Clostridia bacterium]
MKQDETLFFAGDSKSSARPSPREVFSRTRLLLGDGAHLALAASTVAVVGLGGVGGSAAEALARSGVGRLFLVDGDTVAPSNLNRQAVSAYGVLGRDKALAMAERIREISPCQAIPIPRFVTGENVNELFPEKPDFIIDAIDDVTGKLALALYAKERDIPIFGCLGTGNRLDPTLLTVTDLFSTSGDPLARKLRQVFKKAGITAYPVVCSKELPTRAPGQRTIGSFMPVTASAGLLLAAKAMEQLIQFHQNMFRNNQEGIMDYYERYLSWYTSDMVDEPTKEELFAISRDKKEIEDRFYKELEFGTAGLRGLIGAGTNRMNPYVVRRATQGLADYVKTFADGPARGVCIAYDSRNFSPEFARETACVLAANGIRTVLFDRLHPVPMLSYMLMAQNCIAGVVITASHNPSPYNGYKVYWENGAQVAPEQADQIFNAIQQVPFFAETTMDYEEAVAAGKITLLTEEADEGYYRVAQALLQDPETVKAHGKELTIVYTPLNGSGAVPVVTILNRVGITNVEVVPEQEKPDGNFPTVKAPNPEDPDAFTLGRALAEQVGATVILATDPDADRLGICVKTKAGDWQTLTGNQIGALLLYHVLSGRKAAGKLPSNGVAVKSLVSGAMADAVAKDFGVEMEQVLTGFRFVGEKIAAYEASGEKTFLFGFEESYGFLAGTFARDKDAVSSAMLAAEMCLKAQLEGKTLAEQLDYLYETYGYYKEKVTSYTLMGKEGLEKIAAAMEALRQDPPAALGGLAVEAFEDYRVSRRIRGGVEETIHLPSSNMLRFLLADGAWVVVRPSGTEPKLKLYAAANAKTGAETDALLEKIFGDMDGLLQKLLA